MLFSVPEVANYINQNFEPAWVNVRAVPRITVDFGNGRKIFRTVNGNVASYVCTPTGKVIDVIPGIYQKEDYLRALKEVRRVFDCAPSEQNAPRLNKFLAQYHKNAKLNPVTRSAAAQRSPQAVALAGRLQPREMLRIEKALAEDTYQNESFRRPAIHKYLSEHPDSTPETMKKWLYREVLHADLDDPYLGFDKILGKTYPFEDDDDDDHRHHML